MIRISTNADEVFAAINTKLEQIEERRIAEIMAVEALGLMKKRIHEDGLASDGKPIGTYSEGYMKVRTGNYENNKVTRGKRKGEVKQGTSGVYTAGINPKKPSAKVGQKRPHYKVEDDPKVILRLTGQMATNMKVFPLENGAGIGWDNDLDFNKSKWVEETYGRKEGKEKRDIYKLTDEELAQVQKKADDEVKRILS